MKLPDPNDIESVAEHIRIQAESEQLRVTAHAQQEMLEEDISLTQVLEAIVDGTVLENYPEHQRGACCLLSGTTSKGRALHVVCTTTLSLLVIITVYEPRLPKWVTPTKRRES
jgi:hypothetical protein